MGLSMRRNKLMLLAVLLTTVAAFADGTTTTIAPVPPHLPIKFPLDVCKLDPDNLPIWMKREAFLLAWAKLKCDEH